jgi:hypothetical protein
MIRKSLSVCVVLLGIVAIGVTSTRLVHQVVTAQTPPPPIKIGNQIAGTFADATGHSAQSHLVYAANAGVWWLFTLTSAADSSGGSNHIVKAYRSSGSDLATAIWTAAADSPGASTSGGGGYAPSGSMGGGRALGVVYVNNAPTDVIHAEVAMAADGQDGIQGHIRARITATGITWETWNYHVEGAATWAIPRAVALSLSTGKYIHSGGPTLQQEVDANARRSNNPDTGTAWTSGFSSVAVIDNSMINQSNAIAFAPLANNVMLAVYDNGGGVSTCYNCGQTGAPEPNLTNLGYKKSNTSGAWPTVPVGTQTGGDGPVFSTSATIDQNDWALVPVNTTTIRAYRRNAGGTGIDAAAYNTASNTWSSAPAPPPFGAGQAFKSRAGLFGANDGSSTWLFVVNTNAANSILYSRYDGTTWSSWAAVPGTDSGTHVRRFISGAPIVAAGQVGLIWTEGSSPYDVFTTSLAIAPDTAPPAVSLLAPADGSTVFGAVSISASASDDRGVSGVQFKVDGGNIGPLQPSPYQYSWNSRTVANGTHSIEAWATDAAGNSSSASASVTVSNGPLITAVSASSITQSSAVISWTTDVNATSVVDFGATTAYGQNRNDPTLVTTHQVTLAPLNSATTYYYRVTSANEADISTVTGEYTFTTAAAPDTTAPSVSFTAPANGATVSGTTVTVSASASDNVGVAGVRFRLDGVDLGAEDTTSPYAISWNTTTTTNASHSLTAVARDAAGNTASAAATVTVDNTVADTTRPTVVSISPAPNATGVSTAATVRATFSEAMNASTITSTTFILRDGTTSVAAGVAYNAGTLAATLTPSQPLAAGRVYTATITGGSSGVKDLAGNALASDYVGSFTTASSSPAAVTIWSPSAIPAAFANSDTSSVELGVKFRADVAGTVTGVRFYKGTGTTGTHTGTLWSSTGTQLATATFTGETASGWQQVSFASPVAITPNTVYVVSYHTNIGRYAYTAAYFASVGVDNVPLHALRNGVSGGNGVYRYGARAFPNSTYNSNNYWVDVVFVPQ